MVVIHRGTKLSNWVITLAPFAVSELRNVLVADAGTISAHLVIVHDGRFVQFRHTYAR